MTNAQITEYSIYLILATLYVLPFVVSFVRDHRHFRAIGFLSLALGWTVIVWIICMTWALMSQKEVKENG